MMNETYRKEDWKEKGKSPSLHRNRIGSHKQTYIKLKKPSS